MKTNSLLVTRAKSDIPNARGFSLVLVRADGSKQAAIVEVETSSGCHYCAHSRTGQRLPLSEFVGWVPGNKPVLIRAQCTACGVDVEASQDEGKTWQFVQLTPYLVREAPTVRAYSTCENPAQDVADYFAELDRRGIAYKRVVA